MKRYRICISLLSVIVFLCIGYIIFNYSNSTSVNTRKINNGNTTVDISEKSIKTSDNIANDNKYISFALICLNLDKYKDEKYSDISGSNLRIYDYVINTLKTQNISENKNKFFIYCEYIVKPYDMKYYLSGGGSVKGEWKNCSMFYTVEKINDSYVITTGGTGPSEDMLKGEFK